MKAFANVNYGTIKGVDIGVYNIAFYDVSASEKETLINMGYKYNFGWNGFIKNYNKNIESKSDFISEVEKFRKLNVDFILADDVMIKRDQIEYAKLKGHDIDAKVSDMVNTLINILEA